MAKKKQSVVKKRITKELMTIEGFLNLANLVGFCVDTEEDGLKNVSNDWKELDGQFVKITISSSNEEDLTDTGFTKEEEIEEQE